jgi:hypothetical protein
MSEGVRPDPASALPPCVVLVWYQARIRPSSPTRLPPDSSVLLRNWVPGAGIEPARPSGHGILSPERLPVPPPRRVYDLTLTSPVTCHVRRTADAGRPSETTSAVVHIVSTSSSRSLRCPDNSRPGGCGLIRSSHRCGEIRASNACSNRQRSYVLRVTGCLAGALAKAGRQWIDDLRDRFGGSAGSIWWR